MVINQNDLPESEKNGLIYARELAIFVFKAICTGNNNFNRDWFVDY